MEELADQFAALLVEARSPDGRLRGWARGGDTMGLEFADGAYRSYTESELARQLDQLATTLWVRHQRAYVELLDAYWDWPDRDDRPASHAAYRDRLEALVVTARSASGAVTVTSRSLARWEFTVADGALRRLRESQLVAEVADATMTAVAHHRMLATLLAVEVYGPPVPRPSADRSDPGIHR